MKRIGTNAVHVCLKVISIWYVIVLIVTQIHPVVALYSGVLHLS